MRRSNPKKLARQVIGSLKKQFGCAVQVYKMVSSDLDFKAETRTSITSSIEVDNCIILPALVDNQISQSISYISAAKPFVMGGFYGTGKRKFIFDSEERRGLPTTYQWDLADWIIVEDQESGQIDKYEVAQFEELWFGNGWLVTGNRVQGVTPTRTIKQSITDTLQLRLNHGASAVVE